MTIFSRFRYSLLASAIFLLLFTISGLVSATPNYSNLAFMASNLSSINPKFNKAAKLNRIDCSFEMLFEKTVFYKMSYHKFKADHLFDGYDLFGRDRVLITDNSGKVL